MTDEVDHKLIALLRHNARMGVSALARDLSLSRTTVQDRLARLEDRGIIQGYTIKLSSALLKQRIRAQAMLKISPKAIDEVSAYCKKLSNITALYAIAGDFDLLAMISVANTEELDETLDALGRHKGVERTQSALLLSTKFERDF